MFREHRIDCTNFQIPTEETADCHNFRAPGSILTWYKSDLCTLSWRHDKLSSCRIFPHFRSQWLNCWTLEKVPVGLRDPTDNKEHSQLLNASLCYALYLLSPQGNSLCNSGTSWKCKWFQLLLYAFYIQNTTRQEATTWHLQPQLPPRSEWWTNDQVRSQPFFQNAWRSRSVTVSKESFTVSQTTTTA
jgi:hypothetical protein